MATVTKRDLVIRLSNEVGMTQQEVLRILQKSLDLITAELAGGNTVVMRNFGTFEVRVTKAKVGRNPKDPGKEVPIPAQGRRQVQAGQGNEGKGRPRPFPLSSSDHRNSWFLRIWQPGALTGPCCLSAVELWLGDRGSTAFSFRGKRLSLAGR